jgi:hypothetical protein
LKTDEDEGKFREKTLSIAPALCSLCIELMLINDFRGVDSPDPMTTRLLGVPLLASSNCCVLFGAPGSLRQVISFYCRPLVWQLSS